ncbi:hypothetical protein GS429_04430 [Natronorubrum sp. JWXQ-INN-674]|uniref:Uncharacterized protein n=1 Tax=Natronorubrum halalkaliphilum TaxID=2691917 RepID=A0A6B0VKL5_9EURY|nr:hypothetical protein [Natronorubrum halalkaliphilum]MXV61322.1 hypothetical protein [Natronorubrum halalkaliphilum]
MVYTHPDRSPRRPGRPLSRAASVATLSTLGLLVGGGVGVAVWSVLAFVPIFGFGAGIGAITGLAVAIAVPATIERLVVVVVTRLTRDSSGTDSTGVGSASVDTEPSTEESRRSAASAALEE